MELAATPGCTDLTTHPASGGWRPGRGSHAGCREEGGPQAQERKDSRSLIAAGGSCALGGLVPGRRGEEAVLLGARPAPQASSPQAIGQQSAPGSSVFSPFRSRRRRDTHRILTPEHRRAGQRLSEPVRGGQAEEQLAGISICPWGASWLRAGASQPQTPASGVAIWPGGS